jgi:hypothetical protein
MKNAWGTRLFARLSGTSPFLPAIGMFIFGTGIFLLSFPLGLSAVSCPSGKEAGYVYEINWFLNFMLVLPCAFYLAGLTITAIVDAIKRLAAERMFVSPTGVFLTPDEALESWYELGPMLLMVCGVLSLIAMGQALGEWYSHSYRPIADHLAFQKLDPEYSCAWSVATVIDPSAVSPWVNSLFAFVTYLGQGLASSFYLSMVSVVLAFAYWLDRFNRQSKLPDLIPGLDSSDGRLGFEHLEPFVHNLFAASLGFTVALFLIRLQFLYFGPLTKAPSVYAFVMNDVALGFFHGIKEIFGGDASLFDAGHRLVWSTVGSIAAFLILLVVSLLIVSVVLRQAAIRAGDVFVVKRARFIPLRPGLPAAAQDEKVKSMKIWPLRYPSLRNLLLVMAFSATAFVAYKLTLIVVGASVFLGFKRLWSMLSEDEKVSVDARAQARERPGG